MILTATAIIISTLISSILPDLQQKIETKYLICKLTKNLLWRISCIRYHECKNSTDINGIFTIDITTTTQTTLATQTYASEYVGITNKISELKRRSNNITPNPVMLNISL